MNHILEKRILQTVVTIAASVPVIGGMMGILSGGMMFDNGIANDEISNHIRYLSGLLLGIGLCFWAIVPRIAMMGHYFCALMLIVMVGGFARLYGVYLGEVSSVNLFALAMELGVTPLLYAWQRRVAGFNPNQP